MRIARCILSASLVVMASLSLVADSDQRQTTDAVGLCCLCARHSVDESKCARRCVQNAAWHQNLEEPQMNACAHSCLRKGVRQIFFSDDGSTYRLQDSSVDR